MHKVDQRAQVRDALEPPFNIELLLMRRSETDLRPVLVLDYVHASEAWQRLHAWAQEAPDVHYFFDDDGVGLYGVDAHEELRMSVFVRSMLPKYAAFKMELIRNSHMSIIVKTAQFGHFELVLIKDVDVFHAVEGVLNGELPHVDNPG